MATLSNWFVPKSGKRKSDSAEITQQDDDTDGQNRKKSRVDDTVSRAPAESSSSNSESSCDIPLPQLLDFSALTLTPDISTRFDQLANALLFDFRLTVTCGDVEAQFQILEMEFYLQKSGCHEDPFTHGSEEQKISGRWYFHRAPRFSTDSSRSLTSTTSYRDGSRKGLDLTIGGPATSPHSASPSAEKQAPVLRGGILLRTLRRVSDSKVISGPSLLVDEILRLSGATGIPHLVDNLWGGDISAFPPTSGENKPPSVSLYLRPITAPASEKKPPVYRSPRIGLELSHPGTTNSPTHPRVVFVSKPYRYFVHPELLVANGRSQTFLGVYRACLASGLADVQLRWKLVKLTGMKEKTVIKYLADYNSGVDKGNLQSFIGAAGKGASSSPATYLKMMGTLERVQAGPRDVKPIASSSQ